jgi:hypothetical protein
MTVPMTARRQASPVRSLMSLPLRPERLLAPWQAGQQHRGGPSRQPPPGGLHAGLHTRLGPQEVGSAEGAISEGVDQIVEPLLVDTQRRQQLPLGLVLPGGSLKRGIQAGAGQGGRLRVYAKCLDGSDALVRRRVTAALGYADIDTDEVAGSNPVTPTTPT